MFSRGLSEREKGMSRGWKQNPFKTEDMLPSCGQMWCKQCMTWTVGSLTCCSTGELPCYLFNLFISSLLPNHCDTVVLILGSMHTILPLMYSVSIIHLHTALCGRLAELRIPLRNVFWILSLLSSLSHFSWLPGVKKSSKDIWCRFWLLASIVQIGFNFNENRGSKLNVCVCSNL